MVSNMVEYIGYNSAVSWQAFCRCDPRNVKTGLSVYITYWRRVIFFFKRINILKQETFNNIEKSEKIDLNVSFSEFLPSSILPV